MSVKAEITAIIRSRLGEQNEVTRMEEDLQMEGVSEHAAEKRVQSAIIKVADTLVQTLGESAARREAETMKFDNLFQLVANIIVGKQPESKDSRTLG